MHYQRPSRGVVVLRALAMFGAVALAVPTTSRAQAYARSLTLEEAEELLVKRSFDGIAVTPAIRDSARRLFRAADKEIDRIGFSRDDWKDRQLEVRRRRTAQIRALLTRPEDLERYDRNTKVYVVP